MASDDENSLPIFDYGQTILDLHSIALLLNYERASTEPRFRHTKLREVTHSNFETIALLLPEWYEAAKPKVAFVFDKPSASAPNKNERDLSSNMLPSPVPARLQHLSSTQVETYYWQARNHDGCFTTVALFQFFMDLFPPFTRVRVRSVENGTPREYTAVADDRVIVEMDLINPKLLSLSCFVPSGPTLTTGEDHIMLHAVLGFSSPSSPASRIDTILDMASLQFGDEGRGFKGRGLFVLEPTNRYLGRLEHFADQHTFANAKISSRVRGAPNSEWLKAVAAKTKARWENRATEPWCGHCGAPGFGEGLHRCSKCKGEHYCNVEHQKAAWPYHKHFCKTPDEQTKTRIWKPSHVYKSAENEVTITPEGEIDTKPKGSAGKHKDRQDKSQA